MADAKTSGEANIGYSLDIEPPHDSEADRNRWIRWLVLVAATAAIYFITTEFFSYWGWIFDDEDVGYIIGLAANFVLLGVLYGKYFLVYNRSWSAYVTQDIFSGYMVPYGPGLHPALPWESRDKDRNYSLKIIDEKFAVPVQTTTSQVIARGTFQYAASLPGVRNFVGSDSLAIKSGYLSFIESSVSENLAANNAEEARAGIRRVNTFLATSYMRAQRITSDGKKETASDFEKKYGITTVSVVLNTIEFPEDVQVTRNAIDEGKTLRRVIEELYGFTSEQLRDKVDKKIISQADYDKMLNRAMAVSKNAEMKVTVIEGDAGALGAAALANLASSSPGKR